MGSPEVHQPDKISKNPLHPDSLPNDVDVIVPTMTAVCFVCGNDLMNLWDAQCCKTCLRVKIKEENETGWRSKKRFEDYAITPGTMLRIWWRGNLRSAFVRIVLAVGHEEGNPWLAVLDPRTSRVSCWGSHTIQLSINPVLRSGQLGIQKIV